MVKRPNILIIVADDLGFSDLGCYGGEIATPSLDKLAKDGLRMTGFHTASACSPTRSMLLSGTDNHLAGLGQMAERMNRSEETRKHYANQPGYEGVLNQRVAALSEILNQVEEGESTGAYRTMLSGKWHLGLTVDTLPSARGFERNWGLLPGCWNHFKWCARTEDGKALKSFMPGMYAEGARLFDQDELPEDFYSSKTYTDKAIEWLKEDREKGDDRPFFAMMTYTAPHWPLQAPQEYIAKYKGRYDAGPSALRLERLKDLEKLGLIPDGTSSLAHPEMPVYKTRDWEQLDERQKKRVSKTMEIYAGMVECLDHHIGRLLDHLESTGELDNTFVLFMSDNGAEGALMEAIPFGGISKTKQLVDKYYNNSFENLGNEDSFVNYGPRWAQAATAPSRLYKCWVTEGGTRCPCIVRYPRLAKERQSGAIRHDFTTVMDICPTVLELARIPHPGRLFQGRSVHEPKGISWMPWLNGRADKVHDDDTAVGWELFGQQAMRKGLRKILFVPKPSGPGRWELFDLENDPGETKDLYESHSAKLHELVGIWEKYKDEVGIIPSVYEEFGLHDGFEVPDDW